MLQINTTRIGIIYSLLSPPVIPMSKRSLFQANLLQHVDLFTINSTIFPPDSQVLGQNKE